jgi:CheY-like chemotaxis protein
MAKILLIEDDPVLSRMYEKKFTNQGHQVIVASDGKQGLARAGEGPDLILLDIMLPEMPGLEVLKAVKGNSQTSSIPVVVMTNLGEEQKEEAMKAGAIDFILKSQMSPSQIFEKIIQYLK